MIRANAAAWQDVPARSGNATRHLSPGKWSAPEYGCHVRDVLRLYDQRLQLMLTQDGPQYPNWDQDVTEVADRYGEQDPAVVADELAQAARRGGRGTIRDRCRGSMATDRRPQR
jgi:hypothetical protein